MANYGLIEVQVGSEGAPIEERIRFFTPILEGCVRLALDDRWKVALTEYEDEGPVWSVHLSDVPEGGFPVALQSDGIAFRHGVGFFFRWAQGRLEEQLSEHFQVGITYDATDRTTEVGPKEFRSGRTFFDYLTRNFSKPLSFEDRAYIERFKTGVPEGHWEP